MKVTNKHLEKAERLMQKGKMEAALEEYLIAWREEPGNDAIVVTVADLYIHLNRPKDSMQCLGYLFDKHLEGDDTASALTIFRRMQTLGAVEPKRLLTCARLLEHRRPDEAAGYYRQLLETAENRNPALALECLQGLTRLQPHSLDILRRLAEVAERLGNSEEAGSAYRRVGEALLADGKTAEAISPLEEAFRLSAGEASLRFLLAQACSRHGDTARVLQLLEEQEENASDPAVLDLLAEAYVARKEMAKAEAIYCRMLGSSPTASNRLLGIATEYVQQKDIDGAMQLLRRLEGHFSGKEQQKEMMALADRLTSLPQANIQLLEYLSGLLNRLHYDNALGRTLGRLFDLHFDAGDIAQAADALGRLVDLDPYDPECSLKLDKLEGKAGPSVCKNLAGRMGRSASVVAAPEPVAGPAVAESQEEAPEESAEGGDVLEDLLVQAEIFLQYKLEAKAKGRMERIAKLFPREEEKNGRLKKIYQEAGFQPRYKDLPPPSAGGSAVDMRDDLARFSEISRNLSRQATAKEVLFTAVNEIGRLWQVSRCVAGLCTSNRPPSIVLEYTGPGIAPSDPASLGKLVMGFQQITKTRSGPLVAERVSEEAELAPLQGVLASLQVESLVAIALLDNGQLAGILLLEQCSGTRNWKSYNLTGLETLAEQIVLAITNARLRNLMRTLAVTDERSGLLHRESYLTCLLSETDRMTGQKAPLSVALLRISSAGDLPEEQREKTVDSFMEEYSGVFASHLRQNDIAVRYGRDALAFIMPGTTAKAAMVVVEKMRRLAGPAPAANGGSAPRIVAGVGQALLGGGMDSADVTTELINRLEDALEEAQGRGGNATRLAEPPEPSQ